VKRQRVSSTEELLDVNLSPANVELIGMDTILFNDEVRTETADALIKQLHTVNGNLNASSTITDIEKKTIKILFTTVGGDLIEMYRIINQLITNTYPVSIFATGEVASAGVWITAFAHKRYAYPYTTFFLHNMIGETSGHFSSLMSQAKNLQRHQDTMYKLLAERTKMDIEVIKKLCEEDCYLSAEEALEYGIVDEIIKPRY